MYYNYCSCYCVFVFLFCSWNLQFIESEFRGQLPQPYSEAANGTLVIPENMNDMNKEEESRYVCTIKCLLFFLLIYEFNHNFYHINGTWKIFKTFKS